MREERPSGIERTLQLVDGVRGTLGAVLVIAIAIGALRAGGTAGIVLGASLLAVVAVGSGFALRRRPR